MRATMIKYGDTGEEVGKAQQRLLEAGYTIASDELQKSFFGGTMLVVTKAYQSAHLLTPDGIIGPKTWVSLLNPAYVGYTAKGWRYEQNMVAQYVRPATDAAVSQIGNYEVPPHSNIVANNRYGNDGQPWCAFFLSWCFHRLDMSPFGTIGGVYKLHEWAQRSGKILTDDLPIQGGDFFMILRGDYHGHTGLAVHVLPNKQICCVEGNSADAVRGTVRNREGLIWARAL